MNTKLSTYWWVLTIATTIFGFFVSGVGVYIELFSQKNPAPVGLFLIIFGPLIAGLSGIFAEVATKRQQEGR